ncbi:MAG TPA: tripartite tricarboxylate transporter substrate-binding protein [Candidatus Binatia bacterium]|nr:tripartite tricarboxylate transporter substrate-binding protein [Candidatus Binatia bacterium]
MSRIILIMFWVFSLCATLPAQTPYYQGKTLRLIVSSTAGSNYDLYGRLVAQYIAKHIPGKPEVTVQNMPGGGNIIGANYLYTVAKPDGLTFGTINAALYFNQLGGNKDVQFDWSKYIYVGSPDRSEDVMYMRSDAPFKSIHDVRKATEGPKCGSTGTGTTSHYLPTLLNDGIGTKFNIVIGYPGGPEIDLAVERNEVQCRAFTIAGWFTGDIYANWRKTGFARAVVQTHRKRDPRLADVPTVFELLDEYKASDTIRKLADLTIASNSFGRPYVLPPATPAEPVKILREAFMKMLNDPELLTEAKRRRIDIEYTPGEELEKLAKEVITKDTEVIERMKKLLGK